MSDDDRCSRWFGGDMRTSTENAEPAHANVKCKYLKRTQWIKCETWRNSFRCRRRSVKIPHDISHMLYRMSLDSLHATRRLCWRHPVRYRPVCAMLTCANMQHALKEEQPIVRTAALVVCGGYDKLQDLTQSPLAGPYDTLGLLCFHQRAYSPSFHFWLSLSCVVYVCWLVDCSPIHLDRPYIDARVSNHNSQSFFLFNSRQNVHFKTDLCTCRIEFRS